MKLLMILVLAALGGCSSSESPWRTRGARVLGVDSDHAEDPVTGRVLLKDAAVKREYKGAIYFFESVETATIFDRDPASYGVAESARPKDPEEREAR